MKKSREEAIEILLKRLLKEAGFDGFNEKQLAAQSYDLAKETGLPAEQIQEILTDNKNK